MKEREPRYTTIRQRLEARGERAAVLTPAAAAAMGRSRRRRAGAAGQTARRGSSARGRLGVEASPGQRRRQRARPMPTVASGVSSAGGPGVGRGGPAGLGVHPTCREPTAAAATEGPGQGRQGQAALTAALPGESGHRVGPVGRWPTVGIDRDGSGAGRSPPGAVSPTEVPVGR